MWPHIVEGGFQGTAISDAIQRLQSAGWPVDTLREAQRQALSELSPQEVETMVRVRDRLMSPGSEVTGFAAGGAIGLYYYRQGAPPLEIPELTGVDPG